MTDDDRIVPIDNDVWHHYGCRIIRWIDSSIADDCYKLRFGKPGDPVSIVFADADYARFLGL